MPASIKVKRTHELSLNSAGQQIRRDGMSRDAITVERWFPEAKDT